MSPPKGGEWITITDSTFASFSFVEVIRYKVASLKGLKVIFAYHSSDYEAFAYCDKAMVNELTPMATAFIERIKEILE